MIPKLKITNTGIIVPTTAEIIEGAWSMVDQAFGAPFPRDYRTPQGQLVTSLSAYIADMNNSIIETVNNFDPDYADGVMQDALGNIYFMKRKLGTPSFVVCEFIGLAGTVIPKDFVLIDSSNNEWLTSAAATVSANGTVLVDCRSKEIGQFYAATNTIVTMQETITGLDRVSNPHASVVGSLTENRIDFEQRRKMSVSKNSQFTNQAVTGEVLDQDGVINCFSVMNSTINPIAFGITNYPIERNSLLVSVVGGDPNDIARAILTKGGTGCGFSGNVAYNYLDPESGQSYEVKFLRPDVIDLYFKLSVKNLGDLTIQDEDEIKRIILESLQSGSLKASINGTIIAADYLCGITNIARVIDIQVSTDTTNWHNIIEFGVDQFPASSKQFIIIEGV